VHEGLADSQRQLRARAQAGVRWQDLPQAQLQRRTAADVFAQTDRQLVVKLNYLIQK